MKHRALYDLLGLDPSATASEVKLAYRLIAKRHHPDLGGDPERFVALTQAYDVLSDAERRKLYDATGRFDAAAADNRQRDVILTLSSALDLVLSKSRLPIENTDIVGEMRKLVETGRLILTEELAEIEERLASLERARERIKRKDQKENLFVLVIDGQIKTLAEARDSKRRVHDTQSRALDELERYDSVVDVIRSVQSGLKAEGRDEGAPEPRAANPSS
ncbi:MAG TPA: DnaJ domain-containing protein [Mesorhizobium sp.]|nr:DnaJ domain-containing protein [Mesorhizobium sp.]